MYIFSFEIKSDNSITDGSTDILKTYWQAASSSEINRFE